ncbi:DUF4974 domain-containing protein [Croceitalea sp. MTPC9]|uniref:FecR family protein n=1 Tax=unclassified Croceitalea TaxID=2632280 RepID=UPI002B3ECCC5|nr:DUF4974 domain-containing protein [Croceitalea sp. MTPC6]GMN16146.1 DUF4974 domain-containing protein [Croceitalea sp. MTPC9]
MDDKNLIKYLQQKLSSEASKDVEEWILYSEENSKRFNTLKAQYLIQSVKSVNTTPDIDEKYQSFKERYIDKKIRIPNLFKYAAAIVILITTIFIYNNQTVKEIIIPEDAITLELEDGTIKVLSQQSESTVKDETGNFIYKQKGNTLIYSDENTQSELKYNTLSIPNGKTFELSLSDGTKAHLNAGSSIKYPISFIPGSPREIFITGEAYLDVAKDENRPFILKASDLNIRVLGTRFNVHAYPEDNVTEVVLVEGTVSLYESSKSFEKENSTILEPGNKASFGRNSKDIEIRNVSTLIYTSWRNGELVFRDMPFENILKKMERHYNLTIINNNSKLSKEIFNASFGIVPVEKVLEELSDVYGIDYEIEDKTITIN